MTRNELRQRYQYACGYCTVTEDSVGSELTIDHFKPQSKGGTDDDDNQVYSCHACNSFKSDYWSDKEESH
jgi:5-methylcytosine-specific restriction endonuclease McrA